MPMPLELEQALKLDEVANGLFHALTAGKQRNLIYLVSQVKSSEKRVKKALVILDYLTCITLPFYLCRHELKGFPLGEHLRDKRPG